MQQHLRADFAKAKAFQPAPCLEVACVDLRAGKEFALGARDGESAQIGRLDGRLETVGPHTEEGFIEWGRPKH